MSNKTLEEALSHSIWNFYLGLVLALLSTLFIGSSFIVKKIALIRLERCGIRACDGGYGYLKDWLWWIGLILIGVGEGANFIAYAFAPASLVTPLGGLSVLVTAILSSKFLHEHLNLIGKIGCIVCLAGSTTIVLHAPKEQEIESMLDLTKKFLNPGYITYAVMVILFGLLLVFYLGPRIGKYNPLIYLSVSGTIGSLSVMACKGIGVGIREAYQEPTGTLQSPLFWFLIVQLLISITIQMNFLNMALDIFNTNIVTPLLYVIFTGSVLIASSLLFQEWSALTLEDHFGNICGLLCIVSGIFLITAFRELDVSWKLIRQSLRAVSYEEFKGKCDSDSKKFPLRGTRERSINHKAKAFNEEYAISHRINQNNNYEVPKTKTTNLESQNDGFFSSPWKKFYGTMNSQFTTHRRTRSIDSKKACDSDPENGTRSALLQANELENDTRPVSLFNTLSILKTSHKNCLSAPLRSQASSSNGSLSPNNDDIKCSSAQIAFVKPLYYNESDLLSLMSTKTK